MCSDGKTYIFNGDHYWRLNDAKHESDRGYPSKISAKWQGIPDNIDEIFLWGHNWNIYFFKGNQYYKYNEVNNTVEPNYPRAISQGWPGVPDNIDAAFTSSDGNSYFLKGDQVYKYNNYYDQVEFGYPQLISAVWPDIPNNVDSAFEWWYWDGNVYFFKDEYYWKMTVSGVVSGPFFIGIDAWKNLCEV